MIWKNRRSLLLFFGLLFAQVGTGFVADIFATTTRSSICRFQNDEDAVVSTTTRLYTGGWGIGPSRDLMPEEFGRGERRAFEGYQLQGRGDFMRQIQADKDQIAKSELEELLGVARTAGIRVQDPAERISNFRLEDDDEVEDLDVSVQWDEDDEIKVNEQDGTQQRKKEDSITRLDEDTGAIGLW
jgi:hypothetical protein